jgi:homeobox protein cut-like
MLASMSEEVEDGLSGPEAKYAPEYEARLNPFAEFQLSESESRLKGMQLHDKALLAGSRLIAGSKIARAAVAMYAVLLHVFIMVLMYASASPHAMLPQAGAAGAASLAADGIVTLPATSGNATADGAAAAGRAAIGGSAVAAAATAAKGLRLLLGSGAHWQQQG